MEPQSIGDFAVATLSSRLIRHSTLESYLQAIRLLGLWDEPLDSMSVQMLYQKLIDVPNVNTRRKYTVALRSIFRDFAEARALRIPKSVPRIYELPSEDTLRFVLALCPYELQGLLMMYGGLRCGEACATSPSDVRGNVLQVRRQRYQNGRLAEAKTVGEVVIPTWLSDRLLSMQPAVVTPGSVRESFRRYGKKAGIDLNPHLLRHWYATALVRHRINPEIARRQMRHADLKTTLGYYAQITKDDIQNVVTDLFE